MPGYNRGAEYLAPSPRSSGGSTQRYGGLPKLLLPWYKEDVIPAIWDLFHVNYFG